MLRLSVWNLPRARQQGDPGGARPQSAWGETNHVSMSLLLRTFEQTGQGWFWSTDAEGRLTYLSKHVEALLLGSGAEPQSVRFTDLFVEADADPTGRRGLAFLFTRRSCFEKISIRAKRLDDDRCWSISGAPQVDQDGRFLGFGGSALDITEERRSSAYAAQLAKYDPLTGLPNRRRMSEVLDAAVQNCGRQSAPCAVLLVDLDRFKHVNDTLGHTAGDLLLKQVASRLVTTIGDRERVFRLGGDEFQIILPESQEDRLSEVARKVIEAVSAPYVIEGSRCSIGASVGVAMFSVHGTTRSELIRNADLALYAAKSAGRGCYRLFSNELLEAAKDKRTLEEDLRDALARGEIHLAYQPVVDAKTNCIKGVEALLRWHHPRRGPISPAKFIPIAEEAGLISALGEWALRTACDDAAKWPQKIRVAVNVSPIQFHDAALPKVIASALANSGLEPDRLELEITESVFLGDNLVTDPAFETLKRLECALRLMISGRVTLHWVTFEPLPSTRSRSIRPSCARRLCQDHATARSSQPSSRWRRRWRWTRLRKVLSSWTNSSWSEAWG